MQKGVQRYFIFRSEGANPHYTTQFVMQLFTEEGKGQVRQVLIFTVLVSLF